MSLIIIDTDILIDAARQVSNAVDRLNELEQRSTLAVSMITEMELIVGCRNKTELRYVERFLQRYHIVNLNDQACDKAVELLREYRLSHNLLLPDALIAATALTSGCAFITKNQQDYRFIPNLQLLPYK